MGAVSGYLSARAEGQRAARFLAVLFPSMVMFGLWLIILTILMARGSERPIQWGNFGFGLLLWVVVPGLALLLGAWPFLGMDGRQDARDLLNHRTRTVWLPGLASLGRIHGGSDGVDAGWLAPILSGARPGQSGGLSALAVAVARLRCGGRVLVQPGRRRAPGTRRRGTVSCDHPAGARIIFDAGSRWWYLPSRDGSIASLAVILGVVVPGMALLLGTLPFLKTAKLEKYPAEASHG